MLQTVLFCHGCNEKFAVPEDQAACPQCGQTMAPLIDAPTLDYSDLQARGTCVACEAPEEHDDLVGRRLATYSIEGFLGKGGMARVYRAHHLTLERPCALKVLNRQLVSRNTQFIQMFFAEARAAAALVHPNVVTIHNIGFDEGLHLIEMEYVPGRSLQRIVESRRWLDPTQATHLLLQTTSALAEAHRMGMVHRDIKPANIMVSESGVAKLADFGLAKRVVTRDSSADQRGPVGTPYFMAPELFAGQPADRRSDVYAMGVTYYYLLSGELPFVGHTVNELMRLHAEAPVPDLLEFRPDVPPNAIDVIRRALSKDPRDRHADAAALYGDLKAIYGGLRSMHSLVSEALAGTGAAWEEEGCRFVARMQFDNGRSQTVFIESCSHAPIADQLVKIYSVCGQVRECFFRRALELNAVMPHGAIAIEPVDGQPHFVMAHAYPRATCDPDEIRRSVLAIARHADEVERLLTSEDRH
jgi:serine/threonine-protein kinase